VERQRFILPLLLVLLAAPLPAQTTADAAEPARACPAGEISYVFIDNQSIFNPADPELDSRLRWAFNTANRLHVRTKEWVIRRELLFAPGSCFDPFMLAETERLLRGYDFLGRVDVFEVRQPDGTYHVIVSTHDDWSTRVDLRFSSTGGIGIEGVRVTETNVLGTGQAIGLFYHEREAARDYGVSYFTPQLLGTRWDLLSEVGRTRAGTVVHQEIAYPFVGEVSRWAGRQSFRREDQYFDYVTGADPQQGPAHVLVPMREQAFDLTVIRRIGRRGNMALAGAALSYQQLSYPGAVQVSQEGDYDRREPAPDSIAREVRRQRGTLENVRAFGLVGHRNVWWVRREGLDSMRGQEDVRLGAEAVLALGRSLPALEADDDLHTMLGLYAAFEAGDGLIIARGRGDARRDLAALARDVEWDDLYVEAEVLGYLQTALLPRHTLFARAALAGGWNTRTPFQLTLGGVYALRGYHPERLPGGRRLVVTLEDRFYLGWPLRSLLDMGGTVFTDIGRVWAGDAPFGADSGWRGSVGAGLRASFPAGSSSTYRIDVAWPLDRGTRAGDFRVTFAIGEWRGLAPRVPDQQLVRSRLQSVGGDLFRFRQ
jgi:hypothetical protein